jgi:hypothetical protein
VGEAPRGPIQAVEKWLIHRPQVAERRAQALDVGIDLRRSLV